MSFNWNNVKPACCARWLVLPTVYSDALSYGEQLDKFCYQLNQLIENNNILPDFIAEMIKEYINSGAIGEVVRDILADYILNVKYPPEGITPAVGDGSADDTAAIQGCIDYAAENGGVVYFPYGSYLTQPLTMKDGVSLFGFDRYSTKIVLKGGATKPLISGTVADFSIANLMLDGNSGIQVNDVNVVTIMATNVLFTNLIIKDGYTLVNYAGTGGHFQISDVVFGNAVEKCLLTAGNADVQCENVVFNQLSAVGGISVMDIGTDGGFFNVKSVATCNQCIVVSGNKNKISAVVENANIPVIDNGLQNNIEIYGISNKEFYSDDTTKEVNGNYSKHVGGTYTKAVDGNANDSVDGNFSSIITGVTTETFNGNRTVNENNKVVSNSGTLNETIHGRVTRTYGDNYIENITGNKTVNAVDSVETLTGNKTVTANKHTEKGNIFSVETNEPFMYKKPTLIKQKLYSIPFQDYDGNNYNVLVGDIETNVVNVKDYGAVGDGVTDDTNAFKLALQFLETDKDSGTLYVPPGDYLISEQLVSRDVSIMGDGVQVSRLIFATTSASAGVKMYQDTVNMRSACITISDLSILYDGTKNFSGIEIEGEYLNERWQISPIITRVFIGTDKTTPVNSGWYNGIVINNCDVARISDCSINGRIQDSEPIYSANCGVYINSSVEPHGTSHTIENCIISHFKNGVYVPVTEGLKIINNDIIGVNIGVNCEGRNNYPFVLVEGSHINASAICINVKKYKEVIISNNDCYIQQSISGNQFGIVIDNDVIRFNINNNMICNLSSANMYGMNIKGSHGVITGNIFHNQAAGSITPAINLDTTASYCILSLNNAYGLKIDNFGTDNILTNNITV